MCVCVYIHLLSDHNKYYLKICWFFKQYFISKSKLSGVQGRRNGFWIGGGQSRTKIFGITLAYKNDAILCISISVISKIHSYDPVLA